MSELVVQLYCKVCGNVLDGEARCYINELPQCWLQCEGCGTRWENSDAIEQVNIAFAELTDWETYDFFGEWELT